MSRPGFHAWLSRKPSQRTLDDEWVGAMVGARYARDPARAGQRIVITQSDAALGHVMQAGRRRWNVAAADLEDDQHGADDGDGAAE